MLTSQVIFLSLIEGNPNDVMGQHIHGFFFDKILASQNEDLADGVHSKDSKKPFSLSFLHCSNGMYWFRVSSWSEDISRAVSAYFRKNFLLNLNNCIFELIKTSTNPKESVWSDRITIDDFITQTKRKIATTFQIDHFSATSFKKGDSHIPLPVPELIVRSIEKQMPQNLKKEFAIENERILQIVQLKKHKIRSIYNKKNYGAVSSFIGKTNWQISTKAEKKDIFSALALFRFAFYSGIGVKTTQGMGMCRIIG